MYWCLVLENYGGEDKVYYFENYEIAKKNFDILCEQNKDYEEFNKKERYCTWFDASCNEYNTYVSLVQLDLPEIYNEIIF